MRNRLLLNLRRYLNTSNPPSHFGSGEIPQTYNQQSDYRQYQPQTHQPQSQQSTPPSSSQHQGSHHESSIREITALLAMFALAYIAIDNYTERIKIEKLHTETNAINLKALQVQQLNYQKERKRKDLALLQERKEIAKRNFKMGLHIAMLRKQLLDSGVKPVELDEAVKEFESNVKADNSMKNISGQYLWLDDSSGMFKDF
ncbi:uncharacterized protein KGF55_001970 [Candida pseudojiufengensis]|uniref:uncharacterized protein n=1 Tax=Candida pseudojiufengensis TaxID=497109 RepID=UPI002224082D|nr:uncharacterized protein KGF55_001970 [Candida pseudojiufengensis]KAI5964899.1 hypothetical protein KGF55_001970 [Candida pseudojiufengensis]